MLLTHPAASDAYSPLYCDTSSSQDMLSGQKKKGLGMYYRDAGREIACPGLRAAAVERVDVRSQHAGVWKRDSTQVSVLMGPSHDGTLMRLTPGCVEVRRTTIANCRDVVSSNFLIL